tara:strand:- start:482 stop:610 length:129 start_codon:yes stop_codon:yes gene_type:complete
MPSVLNTNDCGGMPPFSEGLGVECLKEEKLTNRKPRNKIRIK